MCAQSPLVAKLAAAFADSSRGVVSAYLHGSYAEGREHGESDVDVGVLLDYEEYSDRAQRGEARLALTGQLGVALGRNDVGVVILNDAPAPLARHVVLDGIRAFCRNEATDHAFRRDVQLRAADLAPFLQRMRRIKLEALRE